MQYETLLDTHPELLPVVDWHKMAREFPLTPAMMDKHAERLPFVVMSAHQAMPLEIVNKYESRIRYDLMARNPHLLQEVMMAKLDKMDLETLLKHQQFPRDFLLQNLDKIQPLILIKHQKLDEEVLRQLLNMAAGDQNRLKIWIEEILTHQRVSEKFIVSLLDMSKMLTTVLEAPIQSAQPLAPGEEAEIRASTAKHVVIYEESDNESDDESAANSEEESGDEEEPTVPAPAPAVVQRLVNLETVARYQQVSEEFALQWLMTPGLYAITCRHQKFSPEFIRAHLDLIRDEILGSQDLSNELLYQVYLPLMAEALPERAAKMALQICSYQNIDEALLGEMFEVVAKNFVASNRAAEVATNEQACLQAVLLRSLPGVSHPLTLKIDLDRIDWVDLCTNSELKPEQRAGLRLVYSREIPWYIYIRTWGLKEIEVEPIIELLQPAEWWLLLTHKGCELSDAFRRQHAGRLDWWHYVADPRRFYQECLEAIMYREDTELTESGEGAVISSHQTRSNLRAFLDDFVKDADWKRILREVTLDEWAIRLFGRFADKIEMYWWKICRYQKLNESMIRAHLDKLDLVIVLGYQNLSEEMLRELAPFFNDDCWDKVRSAQKYSAEFAQEFNL